MVEELLGCMCIDTDIGMMKTCQIRLAIRSDNNEICIDFERSWANDKKGFLFSSQSLASFRGTR